MVAGNLAPRGQQVSTKRNVGLQQWPMLCSNSLRAEGARVLYDQAERILTWKTTTASSLYRDKDPDLLG